MTTSAVAEPHEGQTMQIDILFPALWHGTQPWALTSEQVAAELQEVQRTRATLAAQEAELILALAGARPASADPQPGTPGARATGWASEDLDGDVSEFLPAELSAIINLGRGTAHNRLNRALTWRDKLPNTLIRLRSGQLDERRAQTFADELAGTPADVAAQIEGALLEEATDLSVYRLRDRITALKLQLDAEAAEKARAQAARNADVHLYPSDIPGRSTLAADLPTDEAAECHDLIDQLARMLKADGDPRPIGALRAYVLSALIRRPADHGFPTVDAQLTVTAALTALDGGSTPGEVNGLPITAAHLRELMVRLGALGVTAPTGGAVSYAISGPDGRLLATLTPADLTRLARTGCPDHPQPAPADAANTTASCDCPITGPPPDTPAYTPTDRQRAFVEARDRRCRFPNCGQRVGQHDLDHVVEYGCGGATDCSNLCCLCRGHHRLKTFAPGWRFTMTADGVLTVTTPPGVTRRTRPPELRPPGPALNGSSLDSEHHDAALGSGPAEPGPSDPAERAPAPDPAPPDDDPPPF